MDLGVGSSAGRWSGRMTVRCPAEGDRHLSQRIRSSTFPGRFSLVSTCGSVNERRGFLALVWVGRGANG